MKYVDPDDFQREIGQITVNDFICQYGQREEISHLRFNKVFAQGTEQERGSLSVAEFFGKYGTELSLDIAPWDHPATKDGWKHAAGILRPQKPETGWERELWAEMDRRFPDPSPEPGYPQMSMGM